MNQIIRMVMRAATAALIPAALTWWARRNDPDGSRDKPLTPQQRAEVQRNQEAMKRTRQITRMARRFLR